MDSHGGGLSSPNQGCLVRSGLWGSDYSDDFSFLHHWLCHCFFASPMSRDLKRWDTCQLRENCGKKNTEYPMQFWALSSKLIRIVWFYNSLIPLSLSCFETLSSRILNVAQMVLVCRKANKICPMECSWLLPCGFWLHPSVNLFQHSSLSIFVCFLSSPLKWW